MITIIAVDIYQWCKSYRKTSFSKSRTNRFHGYIDFRYRWKCNRHNNTEGANENVPYRETGNIGDRKGRKHETTCAGHNYMHTNTNTANKTWAVLLSGGKDEPIIVVMLKL